MGRGSYLGDKPAASPHSARTHLFTMIKLPVLPSPLLMQGGERRPLLLSLQAQTDVLFCAIVCCRAQRINYITPLVRNTVPSSTSFFPFKTLVHTPKLCRAFKSVFGTSQGKEDGGRTHKIIWAECFLTPCWWSQNACTVHRASFPLFRAELQRLPSKVSDLSFSHYSARRFWQKFLPSRCIFTPL